MEDNLPELRDIHLPTEAVSIWPLAYGWWLTMLMIVMIVGLFFLFALLHRRNKKIYAQRLLSAIDCRCPDAAVKMSEILRRICVYKYPHAATLFGQAWLDFLNDKSPEKLDEKSAHILLNAPYSSPLKNSFETSDIAKLRKFCNQWIGENL